MKKHSLKAAAAAISIPLMLQAVLLGFPAATAQAAAQTCYYGDLDGDGAVTVYDLGLMKQGAADFDKLTSTQMQLADLNGDFWLDGQDLQLMTDYLHMRIKGFPVGVSVDIETDEPTTTDPTDVTEPTEPTDLTEPSDEPTEPTEPTTEPTEPSESGDFITANLAKHGASLPSQGEANLVVFYVDFPDCKYTYEPDVDLIEQISFGEADAGNGCYPFESISAFYGRASKGAQTFKGKVFRYTTKENAAVYGPNKVKLAEECYEAFKDSFDFTTMDGDGDGKIDATLFTVPTAAGNDDWWPCAGAFGDPEYRVDGEAIGHIITGNAQIESETDYINYTSSYCHELGHCMGLPDYYLFTNPNDSEGMHGTAGIELMDTDAGSDFGAFSKLICGFYRQDQVQIYDGSQDTQTFTLKNAQTNAGNCLIIPNGTLAEDYFSEFFIVEYASKEGNNSGVGKNIAWWITPGDGIRVYHIDATTEYGWNTYFRYASGSEFTNKDAGRRLIRIIDDTDTDNFYHTGDVITNSIAGFNWYDANDAQTVDPGIQITVGALENDAYTVTVTRK